MKLDAGQKFLITTREWFIAPDGKQYRAAFGTVSGVHSDCETLGVQTNRHSANWYVQIGNMTIAGCQIQYVIRTDDCALSDVDDFVVVNGVTMPHTHPSTIYDADGVSISSTEAVEGARDE